MFHVNSLLLYVFCRQSFDLLQNLVQICLEDPNHIVKLHGVKVLDEMTQVLQKDVADANISPNHVIPFQQVSDRGKLLAVQISCLNSKIVHSH